MGLSLKPIYFFQRQFLQSQHLQQPQQRLPPPPPPQQQQQQQKQPLQLQLPLKKPLPLPPLRAGNKDIIGI